jgi:hypothetical protein
MRKHRFQFLCATLLLLFASSCDICPALAQAPANENQFTNPLLPTGPDPWVTSWKGFY